MKNVNKKFTDTNVRVNCRFSYCHVFQPRKNEQSGKMKYDCCIVVDKDDKQAVRLIEEAVEAAKALYTQKFGKPKGKLKTVVHDGDEDRPDDETFANKIFINASSERKPGVKMLDAGLLVDALDEEDFYSGCYGAADINFFPYNANGAMGISCGLNNVLKLEDGEKLAGTGLSADAAFGDLA
jgi:hypothetical protein